MELRFFLCFIIVWIMGFDSFPQPYKSQTDKTYIQEFHELNSIMPFISRNNMSFTLRNKNAKSVRIVHKPNTSFSIGAEVANRNNRFSMSVNLPNSDIDKYGNSRITHISYGTKMRRILMNIYYLKYKGLYLDHPERYYSGWKKDMPYPLKEDLRVTILGFNATVAMSNNFSFKAAFQQSERQLKSAGSIMITVSDRLLHFRNESDSSIIPFNEINLFPELKNIQRGTFNTVGVQPGYGYTYVWNDFYIAPVLFLGGGLQFQNYLTTKHNIGLKLTPLVNFKNSTGYYYQNYYARFVYAFEMNRAKFKSSTLSTNFHSFEICAGFRF